MLTLPTLLAIATYGCFVGVVINAIHLGEFNDKKYSKRASAFAVATLAGVLLSGMAFAADVQGISS